jgi:molybdate transport system substrate-binding protein
MKRLSPFGNAVALVLTLPIMTGYVQAADVRILSAAAVKPVMDVLGPQFESATGHRLVTKYLTAPEVRKLIEAGEVFDVAIANPPNIDPVIKAGNIVSSSRVQLTRSGLGIGVRSGTQKPNVGSSEAFRQALLNAKSVGYVGAGASGPVVLGMFEKLGISHEMKDKLRPAGIPENIAAVAKGEVEILVLPIPLILAASGVELAGAVPPEYQDYIVLVAGVAAAAPQGSAGEALIRHLATSNADAVFNAKGFEQIRK